MTIFILTVANGFLAYLHYLADNPGMAALSAFGAGACFASMLYEIALNCETARASRTHDRTP